MKPRWDLLAILAGVATVVGLAFALPQTMMSTVRAGLATLVSCTEELFCLPRSLPGRRR